MKPIIPILVRKITNLFFFNTVLFEPILHAFEGLGGDLVLDVRGLDVGREIPDLEAGLQLETHLKHDNFVNPK